MRNKKFLAMMIVGILGLLGGSLALCFEETAFLAPFIGVVLGLSLCATAFGCADWMSDWWGIE